MFSFFKKKRPVDAPPPAEREPVEAPSEAPGMPLASGTASAGTTSTPGAAPPAAGPPTAAAAPTPDAAPLPVSEALSRAGAAPAPAPWFARFGRWGKERASPEAEEAEPSPPDASESASEAQDVATAERPKPSEPSVSPEVHAGTAATAPRAAARDDRAGSTPAPLRTAAPGPVSQTVSHLSDRAVDDAVAEAARPSPDSESSAPPARRDWMARLRTGLRKTGSSLTQVFTGAQIGEELYEELEAALLQADAGVEATEFLLADVRERVKRTGAKQPTAVKILLGDAITELLKPLEKGLAVGQHTPTVIMVVGVNGAGKTTTIGKLTRHLIEADQKVMLAAADTFRAAAREQLMVWADRADRPGGAGARVDIVSQEGGDPAGVTYDAVVAAKARDCDVVIADTAGRLTTQLHLMEELKKIRRVIGKAQAGAPHEVLLVIDGNTGQNALSQVQLFDAALELTGLVITKLDGTAKGGVLAAIARWTQSRRRPIAVYFIGVGEKLEDLQTFNAREFAEALLG
jgi:fused signal recognition particle receptor